VTPIDLALVAAAAMAAGAVNAVAGGGTLISFPTLTALGLPPITANVPNAVALAPGYLGGALAQRSDLRGLGRRAATLSIAGAGGGLAGGTVLISTSEERFEALIPFLILFATALLAAQDRIRARLSSRARRGGGRHRVTEPIGVLLASVYGGYFGAGLGIILLGVLGLPSDDPLLRTNALKHGRASRRFPRRPGRPVTAPTDRRRDRRGRGRRLPRHLNRARGDASPPS
jgi:uncharacterized membrane protein YfcA